jgi:hypothetical protein
MPYNRTVQRHLTRAESGELVDLAASIAGWRLTRPEFGTAANVSGIRTKTLTFSRRLDSRTIFATDARYGVTGRAGAWTGDDRTVVSACRRILRSAKVPSKEVAAIDVLVEMGQVAERVSDEEFRVEEPALLRKLGRVQRALDGVPVWSSYATVGLADSGELGSLELHWPEVPATVWKEASVLQSLVERGLDPPALDGARPESIDAGILHSPAIGFSLDIVPAVRVVYLGDEIGVGRKATLYLDRHGEPVPRPRDIRPAEPKDVERPDQG